MRIVEILLSVNKIPKWEPEPHEHQEHELREILLTPLQFTFLTLLLLLFLSMTMMSKIHGVKKSELQEIFDFSEWPLISWTLFYRSDSKLRERELNRICNFPNSVAPAFPVYDGEEHNSQGTGAEAPEDFLTL